MSKHNHNDFEWEDAPVAGRVELGELGDEGTGVEVVVEEEWEEVGVVASVGSDASTAGGNDEWEDADAVSDVFVEVGEGEWDSGEVSPVVRVSVLGVDGGVESVSEGGLTEEGDEGVEDWGEGEELSSVELGGEWEADVDVGVEEIEDDVLVLGAAGEGRNREPEVSKKSRGRGKRSGERSIVGEEKSGKLVLPGGVRLTERDVALLGFLARFRVATVGQLALRFGTSESALRNRLPRLERAGFLAWAWTGVAKPKVWTVTDVGLRVCGLDLSAPQIRWGTLRHSLGLVDIAVAFELAGETVVSEREIRAAATRYVATERMRTAVDMWAGLRDLGEGEEPVEGFEGFGRIVGEGFVVPVPGRGLGHVPDMVVLRSPFEDGSSANIAVELELNRKSLSEWKVILGGYRDSDIFRRVMYYVVTEEVERSLRGSIRALGAEGKVEVQRFVPNERTAEPWASGRGQFG